MSEAEAEKFLVQAVRSGDEDAWRQIIARYQGRLLSFARRLLADRSEAEDLVQETFLGLLRSLPNYDAQRSLETYLFAILRNKLHDRFRQQRPGERQSLESVEGEETPRSWVDADTPSRRATAQEDLQQQRAALAAALREWVESCRAQGRFQDLVVVEMLVVLGLRNKEVAADLGLSETAVAGVKFRVLDQWRKLAQREAGQPEWNEADLAQDSTVGRIWREEGISCLKRSTLGRYLLGAVDEPWRRYVDFHTEVAACPRCQANLEDLRTEEVRESASADEFAARCYASSVGFLSRTPPSSRDRGRSA